MAGNLDAVGDAVAVGVGVGGIGIEVAFGFDAVGDDHGAVAESVAVGVGIILVGTEGVFEGVWEGVAVGVDVDGDVVGRIEGIRAAADFGAVIDAAMVGIGLVGVGFAGIDAAVVVFVLSALAASGHGERTVTESVAVGVGIERVGGVLAEDFGAVGESVAVGIRVVWIGVDDVFIIVGQAITVIVFAADLFVFDLDAGVTVFDDACRRASVPVDEVSVVTGFAGGEFAVAAGADGGEDVDGDRWENAVASVGINRGGDGEFCGRLVGGQDEGQDGRAVLFKRGAAQERFVKKCGVGGRVVGVLSVDGERVGDIGGVVGVEIEIEREVFGGAFLGLVVNMDGVFGLAVSEGTLADRGFDVRIDDIHPVIHFQIVAQARLATAARIVVFPLCGEFKDSQVFVVDLRDDVFGLDDDGLSDVETVDGDAVILEEIGVRGDPSSAVDAVSVGDGARAGENFGEDGFGAGTSVDICQGKRGDKRFADGREVFGNLEVAVDKRGGVDVDLKTDEGGQEGVLAGADADGGRFLGIFEGVDALCLHVERGDVPSLAGSLDHGSFAGGHADFVVDVAKESACVEGAVAAVDLRGKEVVDGVVDAFEGDKRIGGRRGELEGIADVVGVGTGVAFERADKNLAGQVSGTRRAESADLIVERFEFLNKLPSNEQRDVAHLRIPRGVDDGQRPAPAVDAAHVFVLDGWNAVCGIESGLVVFDKRRDVRAVDVIVDLVGV